MYTFQRTVQLVNTLSTPKAVGFSLELTGYLNKTYGLNIRSGLELFNKNVIHWQFDTDGVDKITAINAKMLEDRTYWAMIEKGKDYWLDGSQRDVIVSLFK